MTALSERQSRQPVKVTKNRINSLKHDLELTLRELAAPAVGAVLGKALELALAGDKAMIRLILELHMSKPNPGEDESGGRSNVQILVQNLTREPSKQVVAIKEINDVESETPRSDGDTEEYPEIDSAGPKAGIDDGLQ